MKKLGTAHPNNKGVTLVELLIYLGLSTFMLLILSELFVSILDESVKNQSYSGVQNDGRYITARLRYQINNADTITLPANLGDSSSELRVVSNSVVYRFYQSNGQFVLNDGSGEFLMSSPDSTVSTITFSKHGNVGGKEELDFSFVVSEGALGTAQYQTQLFHGSGGRR